MAMTMRSPKLVCSKHPHKQRKPALSRVVSIQHCHLHLEQTRDAIVITIMLAFATFLLFKSSLTTSLLLIALQLCLHKIAPTPTIPSYHVRTTTVLYTTPLWVVLSL